MDALRTEERAAPAPGTRLPFPEGKAFEEVRSILRLQCLPGVGDVGLDTLVHHFGSATAALSAPRAAFAAVSGREAADRRGDADARARVEEALAWCRERGVAVVHRWAPRYPARLASLTAPPAVLFLQGDLGLLEDPRIVTVVGSRRATEYGRRVARDVAATLARHGAVVASGLALGIDAEAHRATLEAGGKTLAVLGAGLSRPHPRSHAGLYRRIAREGLLVSEFLPGEMPLPHHFPRRNRTLAALAHVVVVVEAAERSGALNTAGHALDVGRELVAVPGSIYSPTSRGANRLLASAHALYSPAAILELLPEGTPASPDPLHAAPPPTVGPDALRVWDAVDEAARHVDELASRSQLAPGRTLVALSLLELGGWVRQLAGARFARTWSPS